MSGGLKEHIKQKAPFQGDAQVAMLNLWVAAAHTRQKAEVVCNTKGISLNHYNILRILNGAPEEGYARSDIIDRMIDRGSDVTRLIDRMVKIGIVTRRKCESDRRRSLHRITDKGRELLIELMPGIRETHEYFRSRVSENDLSVLSRICEGIYADS